MAKYNSRPKTVEAYQLTQEMIEAAVLDKIYPTGLRVTLADFHPKERMVRSAQLKCRTIHGQDTIVHVGDYVVTEPDGIHHYPCKPDIFEASYERAVEPEKQ